MFEVLFQLSHAHVEAGRALHRAFGSSHCTMESLVASRFQHVFAAGARVHLLRLSGCFEMAGAENMRRILNEQRFSA